MSGPVRTFLAVLAVVSALTGARAATGDAGDTIRRLYDSLLSSMKTGSSVEVAQRYDSMRQIIGDTFDLPYMARIAVGPAWAEASVAQQNAMVHAFWRYTAAIYADRFSSYSGQRFEVTGEHPHGAEVLVDSRIVKADGTPVIVRYLLHESGGKWLVADIYLDGTVSELATRHSEFAATLQAGGLAALIDTLNRKADALSRPPQR
jgi:phospholipid transport system substrate-binding protein